MFSQWYDCTPFETAHVLRKLGYSIVLCSDEDPTSSDWQVRKYRNAEITREFQEDCDLNVDLVLGPRSGLIEVVNREGDRNESFRELGDLLGREFPMTPTFESRYSGHRIFQWDDRLGAIGRAELRFKSVSIRIGAGEEGAYTLLPPSIVDGVQHEWQITLDDCEGQIMRLPDCAVDRIIAAIPAEQLTQSRRELLRLVNPE